MKYQLGTYQTTKGQIKINRIFISLKCSKPYSISHPHKVTFPSEMWVTEEHLDKIVIDSVSQPTPYTPTSRHETNLVEPTTPEPLESWKHPYFGKPILVRDRKDLEWEEEIFKCYVPNTTHPVITEESAYRFYKFPDPSIQMTTAELLALAKEVKGVDVELKEGE